MNFNYLFYHFVLKKIYLLFFVCFVFRTLETDVAKRLQSYMLPVLRAVVRSTKTDLEIPRDVNPYEQLHSLIARVITNARQAQVYYFILFF